MPNITPNSIERVLKVYNRDLDELPIPSLLEYSSSDQNSFISTSPHINTCKLTRIKNDIIKIRKRVISHTKSNPTLLATTDKLINLLDEKFYVNSRLVLTYDAQYSQPTPTTSRSVLPTPEVASKDDELTSLRQRLLSGGKHSQLLDSTEPSADLNNYHESIQENILSELMGLTSSLKNSAITLSSKILNDDLHILNETNENIIKNSSLFKVIDTNLNHYLANKSGGKISIFFLLKAAVGIIIAFLIMILVVKIVPQIG
jgi:SNARE protein 1